MALSILVSIGLSLDAHGHALTLAEAEQLAEKNQPQIVQAREATRAAEARTDGAFGSLIPQVNGTASYTRQTANFVPRPGALPSNVSAASTTSGATYDLFNFGITASQLVYDFGQTYGGYKVAQSNALAQKESEAAVLQQVMYNVRSAFSAAWSQQALIAVARDNLENQERHLAQVEALVKVGTRPEIDLAQVKSDRASAKLQMINAENGYALAKAQLNLAMGVEQSIDFTVADERLAQVDGENLSDAQLIESAVKTRPDLRALTQQIESQERQISAVRGGYFPSLGVSTGLTEGGRDLSALTWNWNAMASLTWPLFQGGITRAAVREAEANRATAVSKQVAQRQQIVLDVIQARLSVNAAKASLDAAREVELNAKERLRLAEARYTAGAGSIIERQDAQVAATTASGQVVTADYNLSIARAQLIKALGRK